jgi:hypothetical protein
MLCPLLSMGTVWARLDISRRSGDSSQFDSERTAMVGHCSAAPLGQTVSVRSDPNQIAAGGESTPFRWSICRTRLFLSGCENRSRLLPRAAFITSRHDRVGPSIYRAGQSPQYWRDIQYHSSSREISHTKSSSETALDAIQRTLTRESIELSVFLTQNGAEPDLRWCRLLTCYAAGDDHS